MLDPNGRKGRYRTVRALNEVEKGDRHPHHPLYGRSGVGRTKVIVMDDGKIVMQGTPREFSPG